MNKFQEFEERKKQIESNSDWTPEGKQKMLAKLQTEVDSYRATTAQDLGIQWGALKQRMRRNIENMQAEESKAAAQWDYPRLNYMAQAVKAQVNSAASLVEVQSLYDKAMKNGDTHARRVWCEVVRENITTKYKSGEAISFGKKLQADLDRVLTTPELETLKAEGSEFTRKAAALDDETKKANEYFYGGRLGKNSVFGVATEFEKLSEGVRIERKLDTETLATVTTVSLVD